MNTPFDYLDASAGNYELEKALRWLAAYYYGLGPTGNIYYVMDSNESNYVELFKGQKVYNDGSEMIQPTALAANALTVSNRNDIIFLSANGVSNKVASMLTVANNRVHFIGLDPVDRKRGARSLISNSGAGVAGDVSMIKVTGTGCSFRNISGKNNWTVAQNLSALLDDGANTYFENCDFENLGSAHLTNANAASLILAGIESIYKNCTIGQQTLLATVASGQQMLIKAGTHISARAIFEKCLFQSYTSQITHAFIRAATASIDSGQHNFIDCEFVNRSTVASGGVELTAAVATSTTLGGRLNFSFPRIFGAAKLATGVLATGVFVISPVLAAAAADCVAVQAS